MVTRAEGGSRDPHSVSASSSRVTTWLAFSSKDASTVRCLPAGTGSTASPCLTINGPSRPNSVAVITGYSRVTASAGRARRRAIRMLTGSAGGGVLAVHVGDAERQVEGLAAVEPWVAGGLIPLPQVAFGDVLPAAQAFCDVVAGELDMDPTGVGAELA